MSVIIKTEAVVLSKINYGDSSSIASLFTRDYGKMSVIIKGGRNPKSKLGLIIDPLNHLQLVIYKKESRDIQLISGADLITFYPRIKENLERLKYAYAIIELIKKLTYENEHNYRLFNGILKILSLLETSEEEPKIIFSRFFLFFLTELGYEIILDKCFICRTSLIGSKNLSYNFELGILCENCSGKYVENYSINSELFHYLFCLKNNLNQVTGTSSETKDKALKFLEKYLKIHIPDFKGIQTFQLFNSRL
jgi:DNA repair protein RecO (recombination protein O)